MGVYGEFGCVGFLVVPSLYRINPNPPRNICGRKTVVQVSLFDLIFPWVELALGWGVFGFDDNSYMFSKRTEFGKIANTQ